MIVIYNNLLHEIKLHVNSLAIEYSILRSLQLAVYSTNNIGHFGLNYTYYTHFTSPIRRYADLVVHRICKHILLKKVFISNKSPFVWVFCF